MIRVALMELLTNRGRRATFATWRLHLNGDYSFKMRKTEIAEVTGIRMHRLVADSFLAALRDLFERARNELGNTCSDEVV